MVRYVSSQELWDLFLPKLRSLTSAGSRVLDVGGGARPALDRDSSAGLDYTVLDVSAAELSKAGPGYKTFCGDITDPKLSEAIGDFDVVFSKMVAEHVRNGRTFHANIFKLLKHGGIAFHFFPTLYNIPLLINRLFPERLTWRLRKFAQPWTTKNGTADKFPAFYSWCRGPYPQQLRRLESVGFEIKEYIGSFGYDYFDKIPILRWWQQCSSFWLLKYPIPVFTTAAMVLLRKP